MTDLWKHLNMQISTLGPPFGLGLFASLGLCLNLLRSSYHAMYFLFSHSIKLETMLTSSWSIANYSLVREIGSLGRIGKSLDLLEVTGKSSLQLTGRDSDDHFLACASLVAHCKFTIFIIIII